MLRVVSISGVNWQQIFYPEQVMSLILGRLFAKPWCLGVLVAGKRGHEGTKIPRLHYVCITNLASTDYNSVLDNLPHLCLSILSNHLNEVISFGKIPQVKFAGSGIGSCQGNLFHLAATHRVDNDPRKR